MPEITPSFIQIKKWIIEAAPEYDVEMTGNRAKALAGRYLAGLDPEMDEGRTDYADPTGTEAVRRWMNDMFTRLDAGFRIERCANLKVYVPMPHREAA